jgi:hypothetical protein
MISASPQLMSGSRIPGYLELPRPLRPLATITWSLTESAGLPAAAWALAAWLAGRDAGLTGKSPGATSEDDFATIACRS